MPNNQKKSKKKILIIGVNSGIGEALAIRYAQKGAMIIGTYRKSPSTICSSVENIVSYKLDISNPKNIDSFHDYLANTRFNWDIIIFSVGVLEPIGNFLDTDFSQWEKSFSTNFFGQLQLMHGVRKLANLNATAIFFTGGAPGGVLKNYSSYSIAKIGLTKMVEYLDAEDHEIKYSIVGPGWVDTKIHEQTIKSQDNSGSNLERTKLFLKNKEKGTTFNDIYDCINWIDSRNKKVVGGRNFSVVWDSWGDRAGSNELEDDLINNIDLYKMRRSE